MSALAGIDRFPGARLGHAPTPVDAAPNLGAAIGIDLHIKRDDCTGHALGGNKVRQLKLHFGAAEAKGADTVLVTGAMQSNLVRIAAAAARRLGMDIHIQLEDRVEGMDAVYCASGNLLLDRVLHPFPEGARRARRRDGFPACVNGGGIMLHARRPGGPVAAAQNCATHGLLSVATRGRRCTAWSSMRRFDWRLSTRV